MNAREMIELLMEKDSGPWAQRILNEMEYVRRLFLADGEDVPETLTKEIQGVYEAWRQDGAITRQTALQAEENLACYAERAKALRQICVAHAHMDMDWMWGKAETVSVVTDTFQTMLSLLDTYPQFVFSQSQASAYEIVEKYAPSLLPRIRERVREGRWEVTASTWVEPDKNMTGAESMARHILYTRKYLSRLLDIAPEKMDLDFEPDTFGHSAHIPELLSRAHIKYYYFCRGHEDKIAFWWQSPSGKRVLAYRDPFWYQGEPSPATVLAMPELRRKTGAPVSLCMYGVGDHGGGPSRMYIEKLLDMQSWPLFPDIRLGTLHDFFHALEAYADSFPVVKGELNCVFTGCYTSQSRIKHGNRHSEDRLYDAEALLSLNRLAGGAELNLPGIEEAWKHTLFNQFHDILPGSGVYDTYTHAQGLYQEVLAHCSANAGLAMRQLGALIDTAAFAAREDDSLHAQAAGAGFQCGSQLSPGGNVSSGPVRVYTVFNTTPYDRQETAELTLWDWPRALSRTEILSFAGEKLPFTILKEEQKYWGHTYSSLAVTVSVPAFGYTTIAVQPRQDELSSVLPHISTRVNHTSDAPIVLENEKLRAVFDAVTMKLTGLTEKETGKTLVSPERPSAYFRLISENDRMGYSAWGIGDYCHIEDLNQSCFVNRGHFVKGESTQWVDYQIKFHSSSVQVRISLGSGSSALRYSVRADWHEKGERKGVTPQLQFFAPFGYNAPEYLYDVPGGQVRRPAHAQDVPAVSYAAALPEGGGPVLFLTSDCKYGYRGWDNSLILSLLRSSYHPDPYPDQGEHTMEIGLGAAAEAAPDALYAHAVRFSHPLLLCSNTAHPGSLPMERSFLRLEGKCKVGALKPAEDGKGVALRLISTLDADSAVTIQSAAPPSSIQETDLEEHPLRELTKGDAGASCPLNAGETRTVVLR